MLGKRPRRPKRVVIVHGWRGRPDLGWLKWLADELQSRGIEVINPQLPDRFNPKPDVWAAELVKVTGRLDKNTVFVAHSMGVPTVLRFLSEYRHGPIGLLGYIGRKLMLRQVQPRIGGLVLVAGFYEPKGAKHYEYFGPEPDFGRLKAMTSHRICIRSDDDLIVKPERSQLLADALDGELITLPGRGHFGNKLMYQLPEVLTSVLKSLSHKS